MKIYVWNGENVLTNYGTGLVVVAAHSIEEAWVKLYEQQFRYWVWLRYGIAYIFDQNEFAQLEHDDFDQSWDTPQPKEYSLETLPVLIMAGSS